MPKSKRPIPGRLRSAYEFMKAHRSVYGIQVMCRVLEAARELSGFAWRRWSDVQRDPIASYAIHAAFVATLDSKRLSIVELWTRPRALWFALVPSGWLMQPQPPDRWADADRAIRRLSATAFTNLPRAIRTELDRRGCREDPDGRIGYAQFLMHHLTDFV